MRPGPVVLVLVMAFQAEAAGLLEADDRAAASPHRRVPGRDTRSPADEPPAGLSRDDWSQIRRSIHEAQLFGHGDPPRSQAWFGYSVAVSGDTAVVGAPEEDFQGAGDRGAAYVFVRTGTTWTRQQKLTASDGAADDEFGYAVSISGDTAVIGAWMDDTPAGGSAGSAYVFVRTGTAWAEQQKLLPSDGDIFDVFGASVSVFGDTAVVGAFRADTPAGTDAGAAYVFVRSGTTWSQQQKLLPSDGAGGDRFGNATSLSGETAVVGAVAGGFGEGAAYVFVRSGTTWSQQQKLLALDGELNDTFGASVSVDGDTAVVGAYLDDHFGATDAGSAYVFVRSGTAWSQQQKLLASDASSGDWFGWAVSVSGDTVVVGARLDDTPTGGFDAGSAYVFVRSGTTWSQQQQLVAPDGANTDSFGVSASISGDTLLAGAPFDDIVSAVDAGSAYVFLRSGTAWALHQKLLAADTGSGDLFGHAVSVYGDTAVVGAPGDDPAAGPHAGSAYVFVRSGTAWTEQEKLLASDAALGDEFGWSVSISGDTAAIGARQANGLAGAVYVFVRSGTTWSQQQKLSAPAGASSFGRTVSVSGDTLVVGAPFGNGPSAAGSAHVFVRSGATWTLQQSLLASDGAANDAFGWSVSVQGDTAVVGAPEDDSPSVDAGSAYVFVRSGTTWAEQQKLLSDGASANTFGFSVSVSGNTLVAAAPGNDSPGGPDAGAVYVFVRSGSTWSEQQRLFASDGSLGDNLGYSASLSGNTLVAGAPFDNTPAGADAGAAYVFARSGSTWSEQQKLVAPDGAAGDVFGLSVCLSAGTALVGAEADDTVGGDAAGSAHVFRDPVPADLGVTKTDGQTTAVPGQPVNYTIVVSNAGPGDAAGATVTDSLPPAVPAATWTCVASPGSSCAASGSGSITDTVSLLVGGSATYVLTGTIDPAATGTLINTVTVAGTIDPSPGNNSATDVDTLAPAADLFIVKTDSADPVSTNDPLTYVLTITNGGPSDATGVTVSDTLPAGVTFVSSVPGAPTCTLSGATLTCGLGALAAAGTATVTINTTVNATSGMLVNTASVSANEPDPDTRNNSASAATAVGRREGELAHGTDALHDLAAQPGPAPDEDVFRINQKPFSSYEIVVDSTSGDIGSGSGPSVQRIAPDGSTILQDSAAIGMGSSRSLRWRNSTASEVEGETIRVRSAECGTNCGPDDVYRIRAYETTYSIPRFNNAGTQITVLILQNPTSYPIAGQAYFRITSGILVATQSFNLSPKETLVLNTASIPGANGVSGAITVAHDGRYGDLSGKTVALEPSTGFSFDSPLVPRIR